MEVPIQLWKKCNIILYYKMKTKSKLRNATNKNKTLKKSKKNSCNDFCKNVYLYEINKQNAEYAKRSKISYKPLKKDRAFRMSTCKKNFCNTDCKKKYKYYDKESEKLFKKNMKNNFITNMRPHVLEIMKQKGAISYCDGNVSNPFNKNV